MASYPGKGSGANAVGTGQALFPASEKNQRQGDRVLLTLPIRVSADGKKGGSDFLEEGQTVDVSRHGATVALERELFAGQIVKIQRVGVDKEAMARVVSRIAERSRGYLFGLALLDASVNLWEIVFPVAADGEKAVLRALLRCIACGRLEVSYLNEFETDLFLHHHCISRICAQCGGWTTWTRPYGHTLPELNVPDEANGLHPRPRHLLAPGTHNLRSHDRIQVEAVGCVRHSALGNEVVLVKDLARGGLSFFSTSIYPEGSHVEMAVPYTSKAPNIYAPARIISSRKCADRDLLEYGVAYVL
ncbi:MAG TPA: PilZ domain-containing protein [Candidatus Cybelea sp.]|nr:PilZ domain-containing protein [Candidatus Cybelea sp.]